MNEVKNIGIIVAMGKELKLLLPLIEDIKELEIDGYKLYSGIINGHNITAMQCGIGKVNATIGTLTMLNNFNIDIMINTGVAGGADKDVNVMDVIVGERIAHHDVWCGPGTIYGESSGFPLYFTSDKSLIDLLDFDINPNLKLGLICSGEKFISSIDEVNFIKSNFKDAKAVDMESAAIAQVCYMRNVPFFCLRVISDSPGANHDNAAQYDNFWEDAPKQTFNILKNLIMKI
ncbi:MAG: 5'-methylthioadenosine/adenosylhomocysteine nucleosidase [Muribaculaceae bacterium]|nr:5'-methylthioadenosine/adenosylhomocysteine nucleosidase [Muribaculaceae bacterium]